MDEAGRVREPVEDRALVGEQALGRVKLDGLALLHYEHARRADDRVEPLQEGAAGGEGGGSGQRGRAHERENGRQDAHERP